MIRTYVWFFLVSFLTKGCSGNFETPRLTGGWELQSIQIGEMRKVPTRSERYYFKDDGTVVVSSISSDVDFSYRTNYGLVSVSDKWLLIIKGPLNAISVDGDTINNYAVREIQKIDSKKLVLRFVSKMERNDSPGTSEFISYRTHYFSRSKWSPERVNDTIPL